MEGTSLDHLLNDDDPQEPAQALEPEQAPDTPEVTDDAPSGPLRDENGRFAASTGVEDTGPPPDKLPVEDYKAIRDEREKRQRIERELEALKQQINSQPKEPPAPPPSIWEDDEAWQQHFGSQIAQQASFNAKLDMSEMLARQSNPDFDDIKTEFLRMAESNPALAQQALADPHPWDKAYKIAKNARTMTELGATDLDSLKAKIREELEAELRAQTPAVPGLPPTLSTERNVGARSGPAWTGPRPLSDLLG